MSHLKLRPEGSRAWTPISCARAHVLLTDTEFEVEYLRFLGRDGWRTMTDLTPHEARTRYRARLRLLSSP